VTLTATDDKNMDEIEQHKARIYAALDQVSRIISASEDRDKDDERVRQRDADVIEELEAALAEERAELTSERGEVIELRSRLEAALKQVATVEIARDAANDARAALEEAAQRAVLAAPASDPTPASSDPAPTAELTAPLEATIIRLNARIENQDIQFQRLKSATAQLRESIGILRARNADMLPDPAVINQAMIAELEALKSTRAADVAEMDTILEELKPLVEGQINA
jgi:DNA repair exonuclease SbcCD ATPase subunit